MPVERVRRSRFPRLPKHVGTTDRQHPGIRQHCRVCRAHRLGQAGQKVAQPAPMGQGHEPSGMVCRREGGLHQEQKQAAMATRVTEGAKPASNLVDSVLQDFFRITDLLLQAAFDLFGQALGLLFVVADQFAGLLLYLAGSFGCGTLDLIAVHCFSPCVA
jgi:hypothetical protein